MPTLQQGTGSPRRSWCQPPRRTYTRSFRTSPVSRSGVGCVECTWLDNKRFRGRNRRRIGRWQTIARVDADIPGREFSFIVPFRKTDLTRWSYQVEPHPDGCLLTEEVTVVADLPFVVVAFERLVVGVTDRAADLQVNLDRCIRTIKGIAEAENVTTA